MAKKNSDVPVHFRGVAATSDQRKKKKSAPDGFNEKIPGVEYFNPDEWHAFPFSVKQGFRGQYGSH